MSTLKTISEAADAMFPDLRVRIAIDPANVEMGTTEITLGEWIRSADDFPKEEQP